MVSPGFNEKKLKKVKNAKKKHAIKKGSKKTSIKKPKNTMQKLSSIDSNAYKIGPMIDYANSPYYYFKIGTSSSSQTQILCIKDIPMSCINLTEYYLKITVPKNTKNPKLLGFIDGIKALDEFYLKKKNSVLLKIKSKKDTVHSELYVHQPLLNEYKGSYCVYIKYTKDGNGDVVVGFTKGKTSSSLNTDLLKYTDAKDTYKNYNYAYPIFKIMGFISRNADNGSRKFGLKLTLLEFHMGENERGSKDNKEEDMKLPELIQPGDFAMQVQL